MQDAFVRLADGSCTCAIRRIPRIPAQDDREPRHVALPAANGGAQVRNDRPSRRRSNRTTLRSEAIGRALTASPIGQRTAIVLRFFEDLRRPRPRAMPAPSGGGEVVGVAGYGHPSNDRRRGRMNETEIAIGSPTWQLTRVTPSRRHPSPAPCPASGRANGRFLGRRRRRLLSAPAWPRFARSGVGTQSPPSNLPSGHRRILRRHVRECPRLDRLSERVRDHGR